MCCSDLRRDFAKLEVYLDICSIPAVASCRKSEDLGNWGRCTARLEKGSYLVDDYWLEPKEVEADLIDIEGVQVKVDSGSAL